MYRIKQQVFSASWLRCIEEHNSCLPAWLELWSQHHSCLSTCNPPKISCTRSVSSLSYSTSSCLLDLLNCSTLACHWKTPRKIHTYKRTKKDMKGKRERFKDSGPKSWYPWSQHSQSSISFSLAHLLIISLNILILWRTDWRSIN